MDPRSSRLRGCAEYLSSTHGGDREAAVLEDAAHLALGVMADLLAQHKIPIPRGHQDACDQLAARGVITFALAERLKTFLDVASRVRLAWSSMHPGDLEHARREAAAALRELCELSA